MWSNAARSPHSVHRGRAQVCCSREVAARQYPAQAGALVIPGDPQTVAWYSGSPAVSAAAGTTLLAGHVNYDSTRGALYSLSTIAPGALVIVTDG